ncbi:MAG: hypothetical protein A2V98_07155 [Planctomycetes bacterium RBG_16_64_12]|nr:MAG: hypothetical protein A2V98_07155 [Planctomycetes bacterium RBG_16_64_12]
MNDGSGGAIFAEQFFHVTRFAGQKKSVLFGWRCPRVFCRFCGRGEGPTKILARQMALPV